ncbi:MAG: alpha-L-rhamnosidase [Kiritimatiellae bacterium]|nr:alpha-L-rhamnosidase [Kiritimatiellia bacterium]
MKVLTRAVGLLVTLVLATGIPPWRTSASDPPNVTAAVRRIFLPVRAHDGNAGVIPVEPIDSAAWIWHPAYAGVPEPGRSNVPDSLTRVWGGRLAYFDSGWRGPVFLRFRREFIGREAPLRIHVSADERFELFLDGIRIARGPDRSTVDAWTFKTYEIHIGPGPHRLDALCWSLGPLSPIAQLTWRGGFILKADDPYDAELTTGKAAWQVEQLEGLRVEPPAMREIFGVGGELTAEGCGPQWKQGAAVPAVVVREPVRNAPYGIWTAGWRLRPSTLPDMLDRRVQTGRIVAIARTGDVQRVWSAEDGRDAELGAWQKLIEGRSELTVPPRTDLQVLWDLDDYYCAHPVLEVAGGKDAEIRWSWAESLYLPGGRAKGHRDEFSGKVFRGMTDTFRPDGGTSRWFSTHWWRAGRWCRLTVRTADEPLTLRTLALDETRYPLEMDGSFECDDPEIAGIVRLSVRGMQMCSHETFMDCPYYEQLMYVGDSRLEMLTTYAMTRDDRLVRRGIELFDRSRANGGFVNERFPAHEPQMSTTFSMIWTLMLRDHAWWRNDPDWVRARATGMRAMLELFEHYRNADGLLANLPGWSFMDWVPTWKVGIAPDGRFGVSSLNNLLYVLALRAAAEVETALGEPALAARWTARADATAAAIRRAFWNESRGLLADNLAHTEFSEHAQCLALLADVLPPAEARRAFDGLLRDPNLSRTTIYFSFYLLETWWKMGRGDLIVPRLDFWKELLRQGLRTPVEMPGDTRSDCHAWGSHPLFHLFASVAGIRPAEPWFRSVRVAPQPGPWRSIRAKLPHPTGWVSVALRFERDTCEAEIELPPATPGVLVWGGQQTPLRGGRNRVTATR